MITIVDYGMGNLGSVKNMLKHISVESIIANTVDEITKAEKLLLPGVGAFGAAMQRINDCGFREILDRKVLKEKTPVLGICLGMQLLTDVSEEGNIKGFGWIPGKTRRFSFAEGLDLKVPHMGWNYVHIAQNSPILDNMAIDPKFYFAHSYYVECDRYENVITTTDYGSAFHSIIQKENIFGAQFHPEKSHKYGIKFLENFAAI